MELPHVYFNGFYPCQEELLTMSAIYLRIACENIRFSSLFAAGESQATKSEEKRMFSRANLRRVLKAVNEGLSKCTITHLLQDWYLFNYIDKSGKTIKFSKPL